MKSGVRTYAVAYIIGIMSSSALTIPILATFFTAPPLIFTSYLIRKNYPVFLLITHIIFFCLGNTFHSMELKELIPDKYTQEYGRVTSEIKDNFINILKSEITTPDELSTITAITLGEKGLMDRSLKEAYSKAGAMHILAISGLHVGIIFMVLTRILSFLIVIPGGRGIIKGASVAAIFAYALLTGCSPSVLRATLMIFLYKIAEMNYREISKWDCIGLAALLICIIAPSELYSIGFQLSFAAVIGITSLYPGFREVWHLISPRLANFPGVVLTGIKFLWESLSISLCCQVTTLPLIMYYFGSCPPYFLIANIVAVPLVTVILYLLPFTLLLNEIPYIGELLSKLFFFLIYCLNWNIKQISI